MGKVVLPEEVKILTVGDEGDASIQQYDLEFALGKNEVAIILAMKCYIDFQGSSGAAALTWLLSRKNDLTLSEIQLSENKQDKSSAESKFIAGGVLSWTKDNTNNYLGNDSEYFVLPYPVVQIRPARLFVKCTSGYDFAYFLYYLIEQVTDEQLAKLMVKNHA